MREKLVLLFILYVTIGGLLSHIPLIPEYIKTIIAVPSFMILPWLFGVSIIGAFRRLGVTSVKLLWDYWLITWFVGAFLLSILAVLLHILSLDVIVKKLHIIVTCVPVIYYIVGSKQKYHKPINGYLTIESTKNAEDILCIAVSSLVGIAAAVISRARVPFGYPGYGWMLPAIIHQPALRMMEHGYVDLSSGRWPEFVLTALISSLFNCKPLDLNWALPFILSAIYSFGLYFIVFRLFQDKYLALLTSLFGSFINIGYSTFTPFFGHFLENPRSNTILFALYPLILFEIDRLIDRIKAESERIVTSLFITNVVFVLVYVPIETGLFGLDMVIRNFYIKPIGLTVASLLPLTSEYLLPKIKKDIHKGISYKILWPIFMLYLTFETFHKFEAILFIAVTNLFIMFRTLLTCNRRTSLVRIILLFTVGCYLFVLFAACGFIKIRTGFSFGALIWPQLKPRSSTDWISFKISALEKVNHPIILVMLIGGVATTLLSKDSLWLFLNAVFSSSLVLYALPELWTYRIYKAFTPFMATILAASVVIPIEWFPKYFSSKINFSLRIHKLLMSIDIKFCLMLLLVLVLLPTLVSPAYKRFSDSPDGRYHSLISEYEYNAAMWLRSNVPENVRIISDVRTMIILTPLANKKWLIERKMNVFNLPTQYIKERILLAQDSKQAYQAISALHDRIPWHEQYFIEDVNYSLDGFIIVISARTQRWLEQEGIADVEFPHYGEVDPSIIEKFMISNYFKLIYVSKGRELYIFQVQNSEG